MNEYKNLTCEIKNNNKIWIITFTRENKANSIDKSTAEELKQVFKQFDADEKACVAILTGGNKYFCAGADLHEVDKNLKIFLNENTTGNKGNSNMNTINREEAPLGITRETLSKPVIAAITGPAVAGGLEIALWCDLRVTYNKATLGVFCRRFGVPLIDGGTYRLPALIGLSRAMDMVLTGREVSGEEAYNIGFVNRLVANRDDVLLEALNLAHSLCDLPQICMRNDRLSLIKNTYNRDFQKSIYNEFDYGIKSLNSGEAIIGSDLFLKGDGKHGKNIISPKF